MTAEQQIPPAIFSSLAMLVTDASLTADEPAIRAAHDGLRRLYGHHVRADRDQDAHAELRGHLLGLIDMTTWALRRLPSGLQLSLDPQGHAARFLVAITQQPGLSNEQLAELLDVDITEVSRIGRKMIAAGVAWKSRQWRHNSWGITPRGAQYLEESGLISAEPDRLDHCVGVKVRPSALTGVVTDANGDVQVSMGVEVGLGSSQEELTEALAHFVHDLLDKVPPAAEGAKAGRTGLGVELGGHVETGRGDIVNAPNYAGADWSGLSLAGALQEATGLPTVLENDANALAQLTLNLGDAGDSGDFAVVLLDQGVGAGLMVGGRILHGAAGAAGEIGHVVVDGYREHRCSCGNIGCLESVAGTGAIARRVHELTGHEVPDLGAALALFGGERKSVDDSLGMAGRALGLGIADLLNLTNPARVVVYGPEALVTEGRDEFPAAQVFMAAVRRTYTEHAFSTARDVELVTRAYDDELGARAAAAVALDRLGRR
ncbi:ROK family protein [Streptomyces sp. CA-251387]|uniref:ROK family protein n=1 Tax=Streptomyces sp. CA-251387 TaxID=3240064 RepID=UPI003D94E542